MEEYKDLKRLIPFMEKLVNNGGWLTDGQFESDAIEGRFIIDITGKFTIVITEHESWRNTIRLEYCDYDSGGALGEMVIKLPVVDGEFDTEPLENVLDLWENILF